MELQTGYNLVYETWENDGDFRDNKVIVLNTPAEVTDVLNILGKFRSINNHVDKGIGNCDLDTVKLEDGYKSLINELKTNKWFTETASNFDYHDDEDSMFEAVLDIFDLYSRDQCCDCSRVFDSFKVFYIQEIADVTHKFTT